jgi:hypothetical protein
VPFTQKLIRVTFTGGGGGGLSGSLDVTGLRTFVHAVAGGQNTMIGCDILIYGMTLSNQNQLSTLGWKGQRPGADTVDVYAGDSNGMSHVYKGTIWAAYSDYQGGPNVPFHVVAHAGSREAGLKDKPTSINNKSADVSQIMSQLAGKMGLQFENNGVKVKIAFPYLPGSLYKQARLLANHANINMVIDRGTLAISPADGSRKGNATVGPNNGLVGYPSWSAEGIRFRTIFNPDLMINGQVTIQGSAITPANGTWTITRLEHSLQSLTPNGEFFSNVQGWTPKPGQPEPGVS